MSNNLTRKGLAVSSGLAIALTSLVGVAPATAAAGDVTISPDSGSTWAVFNSDEFNVDTDISVAAFTDVLVGYIDGPGFEGGFPLAYQLTNSDGQAFELDLPITSFDYDGSTDDRYFQVIAYDSRNVKVYDSLGGDDAIKVVEYDTEDGSMDVIDPVIDFDSFGPNGASRIHLFPVGEDLELIDTTGELAPEWELGVTPLVYDSEDDSYGYAGYGDGDFSIGVRSWFEVAFTPNYASVESAYASSTETIDFYDPQGVNASPRIERFVSGYYEDLGPMDAMSYTYHFNGDYFEDGEQSTYLSFSVGFSKEVNFDQVNLGNWNYSVLQKYGNPEPEGPTSLTYNSNLGSDYVYLSGTEVDGSLDDAARLYVQSGAESDADDSYRVTVQYGTDTDNKKFTSGGYQQPLGSEDAEDVSFTALDVANTNQEDSEDSEFAARSGTKAITYSVQLMDSGDDSTYVPLKEAAVPVLMVVWSNDYLSEDATISVTGSSLSLSTTNAAVVASGVTDANGKANFTVTHSSAKATEGYSFELFFADEDGDYISGREATVVYEDTAVSLVEPDNTIVGGAKVDLTFSVTDQFGQPIAKRGTTALNVDLVSSNGEDLDLSAAVAANGEAKFSFNNYLLVGETDVLTAQVLAGTRALSGVVTTVDLYNSAPAASITAPASVVTVVSYADYITGAASATNVAPALEDGVPITGTVLDASGAGIPGAVATVSGAGLQFRKDGVGAYAKDSITVVADSNGQFTVRVWAQKVSKTGHIVTLTSGGKSATTKVVTHLPVGLGGDNLQFTWVDLPTTYVKNQTYPILAKLSDKWGNPIATKSAVVTVGGSSVSVPGVVFEGTGSVNINSSGDAVGRNFNADGIATVFVRSVTDVTGPGSFTAALLAANYVGWDGSELVDSPLTDLAVNNTDNPATAWNETLFTPELEKQIDVLNTAPVSGKVNVGSFNGKLVVYAAGLNGKTISWKVGGNWGKAVATSDFARFDRPTPRRGVDVRVQIFVDGQLLLTKVVTTR